MNRLPPPLDIVKQFVGSFVLPALLQTADPRQVAALILNQLDMLEAQGRLGNRHRVIRDIAREAGPEVSTALFQIIALDHQEARRDGTNN